MILVFCCLSVPYLARAARATTGSTSTTSAATTAAALIHRTSIGHHVYKGWMVHIGCYCQRAEPEGDLDQVLLLETLEPFF